jgi:hypothetical protein
MSENNIKDLMGRINKDLDEIENAQATVQEAAAATKKLKQNVEKLMANANEKNKQFDELLEQNLSLLTQIKGVKLDGVKSEMEKSLKSFQKQYLGEQEQLKEVVKDDLSKMLSAISVIKESSDQLTTELSILRIAFLEKTKDINDSIQNGNQSLHSGINQLNQSQEKFDANLGENTKKIKILSNWFWVTGAVLLVILVMCSFILINGINLASNTDFSESTNSPALENQIPEETKGENNSDNNESSSGPVSQNNQSQEILEEIDLLPPQEAERLISARAGYALTYIKRKNFARLAQKYFHPEKGVHFYPKGFQAQGRNFSNEEMTNINQNPSEFAWGQVDGSPLQMDFNEYYQQYIFDEDYTSGSEQKYNELDVVGGSSLSIAQIAQRYPNGVFAVYSKAGKSLILIFENVDGGNIWYLSGVVHNEL